MQDLGRVLEDAATVRGMSISDVPTRPSHSSVVLVEPTFFDRTYVINPYMDGEVDRAEARDQWDRLRDLYNTHVDEVRVLDPEATWEQIAETQAATPPAELPDMVFVANHAVPTADGSGMIMANMSTAERAGEPAHFRAWASNQGYRIEEPPSAEFEGMGDALWHPGRRLLWGGHGVRTDRRAYDELQKRLDATVVPLELTDERYYHLDVCLAPLSESTALIQPEAFTAAGREKIGALFETVLEAPAEESTEGLAVNVEVVGDTVILGSESPQTTELLEQAGFDVVSVDTDEFQKAGGSVCCLSLFVGPPEA